MLISFSLFFCLQFPSHLPHREQLRLCSAFLFKDVFILERQRVGWEGQKERENLQQTPR